MPDRPTARRTPAHALTEADWSAIRRAAEAGAARRLSPADRDYEDAVQAALLAVLLRLGTIAEPRSFALVVAERKAIDLLRRADRRIADRDSFDAAEPALFDPGARPDETLAAREIRALIVSICAAALTPREREALRRHADRRDDPATVRGRSEEQRRRDRADDVHASRARTKLAEGLRAHGIHLVLRRRKPVRREEPEGK